MGKKSKNKVKKKQKSSQASADSNAASAAADVNNNLPPSDDPQPNTFSDLRQQLDAMKAILDDPPNNNASSQSSAINALSQRLDAMKNLMGELPTTNGSYGQEQSDKMKSLLERMENLGPLRSPIDRNDASLDSRSEENLLCHRKRDKNICIGRIVTLEGLQSATGKQLNGKQAMILSEEDEDGRWECKVLHRDRTVGIKKQFMKVIQPEDTPHPEYMEMSMYKMSLFGEQLTVQQTQERTLGKFRNGRGICYNDEPVLHRAQKLVQLLDFPDEELDPIGTVMLGVSDLFYSSLARHEAMFQQGCSIYDLEHMAASVSLASMAQAHPRANCPSSAEASECVMFALMEAAPRSLETLLSFIVMTPHIGKESDYDEEKFHRSREHPALTAYQDNAAYIDVIKSPIGLLCFIMSCGKEECYRALFKYMEKEFKELFPLMLRRLFTFLARESAGTADGLALGKYVRNILAHISLMEDDEFPMALYYYLCECDNFEYRPGAQQLLIEDHGITRLDQVEKVIMQIVDPDVAVAFYNNYVEERRSAEE